ncbi:MAG: hypothetical protein E5W81_04210 [Mesorhizobium sp.]|nr:MAG: hypothetical protein E5V36_00575 [Mesorhizobium sp.]TKB96462.1 MAG: hypothetical protein E5W81_04210 [Mesorhizobium sp.]
MEEVAWSWAETFFEQAIKEHFETHGYLVHTEYGFGGPMRRGWNLDRFVIFGGRDAIVEQIHEALITDLKVTDNLRAFPSVGRADFLLIPTDGRKLCGVLEVGALKQASEKRFQVNQRVAELQRIMETAQRKDKCSGVRWQAEPWRPLWPAGERASEPFDEEGHYLCAEPTWRFDRGRGAPPGVLLYEVHKLPKERYRQRLAVPSEAMKPLADSLYRWLELEDGAPGVTLRRRLPDETGRKAIASVAVRRQMNSAVLMYGAAAVVAGVAALLLVELGPADAPLIAATFKFVEAAAAAAVVL